MASQDNDDLPCLPIWPAHCALCGLPHDGIPAGDPHSAQGAGCSVAFSADGLAARGHYGSRFDGNHLHASSKGRSKAFAGLDPVCDACMASALIEGLAFDTEDSSCHGLRPLDDAEFLSMQTALISEGFKWAASNRRS